MKRFTLLLVLFAAFMQVQNSDAKAMFNAQCSMQNESDLDSLYAQDMLKNGTLAPDFVIDSVSNTTLESMRGRFVVIHFWASWCPDCRKDTPAFNEILQQHASDSIVFINISFDTNKEAWQKYVSESSMGGLHLSELKKMKESPTATAWHVRWIPSYYVLNTEGKVILATVMLDKLRERLLHLDLSRVKIPRSKQSRLPSFPGGDAALAQFLSRNVNYPRAASNVGLQGQTIMQFLVNIDGSISDISVKESRITVDDKQDFQRLSGDEKRQLTEKVLQQFGEEGMRVVKLMPKWKPGIRFGIPFKTMFEMPINFKMKYNDD